ncbi:MAG TPA: NADH-quinone oxidoreductase subunit D [Acidobacteriota bacterium]
MSENRAVQSPPDELHSQTMQLTMGPSHPAMHGIIEIRLVLDGEKVMQAEVEIGYLHRAFEKSCEQGGWNNAFPYTDRLNYVSPLINNVGYAMAVEKLLGIQTTERCNTIRVLMSELSRVTDHMTCIGASAMELGAMSVFLYLMKAREFLYDLVEAVTGARLTISYLRVGGVKADLPEDFAPRTRKAIADSREVLSEVDKLLTRNRIFVDRMQGTGVCTKEQAISYGITGPFLRSTGIDFDVRKANPYLIYDQLDWDVPIGSVGDNYDRYLVRMAEIEQSFRIVEQCLGRMPEGPLNVDAEGKQMAPETMVDLAKLGRTEGLIQRPVLVEPTLEGSQRARAQIVNVYDRRVVLPPKEETYASIEGLMNHFKIIMSGHGIRPPAGEAYQAVEGANGELGFYVVSDGGDRPWRVRCRPPCFPIMALLSELLVGEMVADIVPTFGSVNMIGGELDR